METIRINFEEMFRAEVQKIFEELIKRPEVVEALCLLDKLPQNLKYHTKDHTLDVIKEIILFALVDGQSRDVIDTEVIAGAWHDVGHVSGSRNHESLSVDLFKKSKTYSSLPEEQSQRIIQGILDTQVVNGENGPCLINRRGGYGYLLDADVSNFGREDFFEMGKLMAQEIGVDLTDTEARKRFLSFTLTLLKNHDWKTKSARTLRQEQKERNMERLEEELRII